jgi:hypothetical protein
MCSVVLPRKLTFWKMGSHVQRALPDARFEFIFYGMERRPGQ